MRHKPKKTRRRAAYREPPPPPPNGKADFVRTAPVAAAHFELHDDGTISPTGPDLTPDPSHLTLPKLVYRDEARGLWLYHGNCLELLDVIAAKYTDGRFDMIFADPPYFLSNGGITCHAGKMVKVDKGNWDKSRGPELNHEFNIEWLKRCQKVLKPNGTIWVTGTQHVIFSIGYAMQQLGFKILNDIAWEKPNPPPNLSCRYFTHSTETVLWAAKNEKSKHVFNYDLMRRINGGKQMKTVWTMTAPGRGEKDLGKHPTQKPIALVERCLLASTNEGDYIFDPFLGSGTTAMVSIRQGRTFVGIEMDFTHLNLAVNRAEREIALVCLLDIRVRFDVAVTLVNDLDLFPNSIKGSRPMNEKEKVRIERIFRECKFVFLSCSNAERGAIIHTTVDADLDEAWAKVPKEIKPNATHVVRCETEIFRVKSS